VYDVSNRRSFENLKEIWMKEVDMYSTIDFAAKMVVANKIDLASERTVSTEEGARFAKENGCLFVETSAKADTAVGQAFQELILKILETPELIQEQRAGLKLGSSSGAASGCSC
jgi:Ras-related protein Rab-18